MPGMLAPARSDAPDMNQVVGTHDLLLLTLDTLRYDVAQQEWESGRLPTFSQVLPRGWERRHAPGNFTYASHQAMFAGFFPTPLTPGPHRRLLALAFEGSESIGPETCVLEAPNIVRGLEDVGYHTICIGGVGFFNKQNPLGSVLPDLFQDSHWTPDLGVTHPDSTENQVRLACALLKGFPAEQRVFLFINISALHQPNCHYLGESSDSRETQAAALRYVDGQLSPLLEAMSQRGPLFGIACSDHGTAYGEGGYVGHRVSHPVVWEVPYGEWKWEQGAWS
jgi:hypothetical protein